MDIETLNNFIDKYSKVDLSDCGVANRHLGNIVEYARELKAIYNGKHYWGGSNIEEMKLTIPEEGSTVDGCDTLREIMEELITYKSNEK